MADIEVIKGAATGDSPADKLSQAYPKINRNFERLNTEAAEMKQQLDNIVNEPVPGKDIELVDARLSKGGTVFDTLKKRLDTSDDSLALLQTNKANKTDMDAMAAVVAQKANQSALEAAGVVIAQKADITYVNTQIANIGDGSPKGSFATLAALQAAYPTGTTGIYVVTGNGNWYYWNGSAWTSGGTYQSTGISNRSISPVKLNVNFDFFPVTSVFAKRTVDNAGNFIPSSSRYTSDYLAYQAEYVIINTDSAFEICVRLFDENKNVLYTSNFVGQQINMSDFLPTYPATHEFLIYVANAVDKDTIANGLEDRFASAIYVKTNNYPARKMELDDQNAVMRSYRLASWFDRFPKANFDKSVFTTDDRGYLKLASNISTTEFHKWLLYYKTDEQRKVFSVRGTFFAGTTGAETNRVFIESSDGRVIWFAVSTTSGGVVEAYALNKVDGTFIELPTVVPSQPYTYPLTPALMNFEVRLVGKAAFLYVDGIFYKAVDLKERIGDKINRAGMACRGTADRQSILADFEVQYRPEKLMHISFDDTFSLLKQLTTNEASYTSLFDHSTFAFLRDMHNTYGAVFTFYLFYARTDDTFTMANVTTKFKSEFMANASWLKFGYHSLYEDTRSANLTDAELITNVNEMHAAITNFAGADSIDKIVRFGYFSVNQSALIALNSANLILGALTADDNRADNSGLSDGPLVTVQNYDRYSDLQHNIHYFRSETRFDGTSGETLVGRLNQLYNDVNNSEQYILFAHSVLNEPITAALEWAYKKGDIRFGFPMNIV